MVINCFSLASKVIERHNLLLATIGGVFDEEEHANWLAKESSWILPTVMIIGGFLDQLLIIVYMKFAHPWKDILTQDKEKVGKLNDNMIPREKGTNEIRLIAYQLKENYI